ncbi:MAG: DUF1549 and DUF1553 domain-containing protein [Verrucomicrobiota bacterium]
MNRWAIFGRPLRDWGVMTVVLLVAALPAHAAERLDFRTRILPILTKAGCNAGACHGAAVGQGGFKLSLLGYDPVQDHLNITRELGGRRVDVESPGDSLLLRKPTRHLDHEGGRRIKRDSEEHRILQRWIAAGAPYGPADLRVARIVVEPADSLLRETNRTVQLRVTAHLSDGTREDVSARALYSSNDDAVAEVTPAGLVTTRDRGLTSIMVRYSGQAVAARVAVPFGSKAKDDFAPRNFVDEKVLTELRRLKLPASPLSDDSEFLRRMHLDLIGRLPDAELARSFLQEPPSEEKRRRVIAALLASDEFVDFWTLKLGDWLLINARRGSEASARVYHDWVRAQVARNRPFDEFARELILARGDMTRVGPANYFALANDPRDLGEHVGRMFLGTQIACARCHAHPADRWTQDDYYAFAAYFARVTKSGGAVEIAPQGEVEHPKTQRPVMPRPLGAAGQAGEAGDRRVELAEWLVSPDNPLFARNVVNRVWKHLLGRGLVEPVDDLRPTNPPVNPALMNALANDFARNGFDLRRLVRLIAESRTYQLSSRAIDGNRRDDRFFSHAYLKPLPAQVLADAVAQVTGVPDHYPDYAEGTRAVQLVGAQTPSYALDVLGRCAREQSCESPGRAGGGLAQALHLINGSTINDKLRGGALSRLLARGLTDSELIDELYLRTLSRPASAAERAEWEPMLARAADKTEIAEDLLWALLNSREFAFNH